MNKTLLACAFLIFSVAICGHAIADDEADVRAAIRAYVDAFNRADASGIAEVWSEGGVWIGPGGNRIVGRQAIQAEMEAYFVDGGGHIEVIDPTIRLLAPTVAVEEGRARVTRPGELPSLSTYIAIHLKEEAGWKLESVRETEIPAAPSSFDHLKELEWMIGTWVDRDEAATIETTCKWTKHRNFMTRSFRLEVAGKIDLEGTQVIGYDMASGQIRSWIFDSAGGFGESTWHRDGDRWIIKNSQTLQDGSRASSINVITYIDRNTCTWSSHGRELDGELLPGIEPVTVVRVTDDEDEQPASDSSSENIEDPTAARVLEGATNAEQDATGSTEN